MTDDVRDLEPEDAYDAGDPPAVRLGIVARIIDELRADPDRARVERRRLTVRVWLESLDDELAETVAVLNELRDRLAVT